MKPEDTLAYADVPPAGYVLASNAQSIGANDLVFFSGTAQRDAGWERPKPGQNIIGASVHDHWPTLMGLAVFRPK